MPLHYEYSHEQSVNHFRKNEKYTRRCVSPLLHSQNFSCEVDKSASFTMLKHFKSWLSLRWSVYLQGGAPYQELGELYVEAIAALNNVGDCATCNIKYDLLREIVIKYDRKLYKKLRLIDANIELPQKYIPDYKQPILKNPHRDQLPGTHLLVSTQMEKALEMFKIKVNACFYPVRCSELKSHKCVEPLVVKNSITSKLDHLRSHEKMNEVGKVFNANVANCYFDVFHVDPLQ